MLNRFIGTLLVSHRVGFEHFIGFTVGWAIADDAIDDFESSKPFSNKSSFMVVTEQEPQAAAAVVVNCHFVCGIAPVVCRVKGTAVDKNIQQQHLGHQSKNAVEQQERNKIPRSKDESLQSKRVSVSAKD